MKNILTVLLVCATPLLVLIGLLEVVRFYLNELLLLNPALSIAGLLFASLFFILAVLMIAIFWKVKL